MITADEVAKILGVSRGAVYDLAAPKGPIPCVRLGRRCVRFNLADVETHIQKCTHTQADTLFSVKVSTKAFKVTVSEPQNCFQKLGIVPKPKLAQ